MDCSSGSTTADIHNFCEDSSEYGDEASYTRITKIGSEEPDCHRRRCQDISVCGGQIDYTRVTKFSSRDSDYHERPRNHCPDISYFTSVITPLSELNGHSELGGCVEFRMRRKNKTVTLQWEPFTGTLASNGVSHLSVAQSISNTPPYTMTYLVPIKYRGVSRVGKLVIDPFLKKNNIMFFLHLDGSSHDTNFGDTIAIDGGSAVWIID